MSRLEATFLVFSIGVRLGVLALNPFIMKCSVCPPSVKLSFRFLAVILGFLSTCRLKNLAVPGDSFFRPRPYRVATVPVALNFRIMLLTVPLDPRYSLVPIFFLVLSYNLLSKLLEQLSCFHHLAIREQEARE